MLTSLKFLYLRAKRRWLGLVFWVLAWTSVGVLFAFVFNSIKPDADKFNELVQSMPKSITSSFNIGANYLSKPETFLSGQFLTIFSLIGSIFTLIMGVNEIGEKIVNGTIVNWLNKNISRVQLYVLQAVANIIYIIVSNTLVWLGIYTAFTLFADTDSLSTDYFVYGSIGTGLLFLAWASIGQALGVLLPKSLAQNIGIGVIVLSWFINNLSTIQGFPSWARPFSLFYFFDNVKLRDEFMLNADRALILPIIILISILIGTLYFRHRDIQV